MIKNDFKLTLRVAKIELNTLFYSPVAWLVLLVFVAQVGYSFVDAFVGILHAQELGREAWSISHQLFSGHSMQPITKPILRSIYLYIPLVTMGLMSREYQSGSIRLLYSSPIKNSSIILGKFLSMMLFGLVLISVLGLMVMFSFITVEHFDLKLTLISMLGLYLLILAYSAIGLFMSSLTRYQVVAAIGTLAVLALLNSVDQFGQEYAFVRDITYWLGMSGRATVFLKGLFTSEDFFYFIIVIALFLSLSIFKLNAQKSTMSLKVKLAKSLGIVAVFLLCGYATTLPQLKYYYDGTVTQVNTLAQESQDIVKGLETDLTITTYVNLFDEIAGWNMPRNVKRDRARLEQYIRFKPDIKLNYVYYYADNGRKDLEEKYPNTTLEEKAEELCKIYNVTLDQFLTPEEVGKLIDLEPERYQWIRVLETGDGEREIMRMFDDHQKMPTEAEMSVVFNRLTVDAPQVAFATGYGMRDISNYGARGYSLFGYNKWFRHSLYSMGFDVKTIDLDEDSFEGIEILVVTDINEPLSEKALQNLYSYIDKGGNMFILSNYGRGKYMNELLAYLGVSFEEGYVVQENEYVSPVVVTAAFTEEGVEKFPIYRQTANWGYGVAMPTVLAIDHTGVTDFEVTPVLKSNSNSWIEYETHDFVDGVFECNPEAGEKRAEYTTLIAMERQMGEREQKIIVAGDADFISNEELTTERPGISASNYAIVEGAFRWFSDDKYPVVIERPRAKDSRISLPPGSGRWVQAGFIGLLPISLLTFALVLIVRRQRK